jgi:hypothetical protein
MYFGAFLDRQSFIGSPKTILVNCFKKKKRNEKKIPTQIKKRMNRKDEYQ